MSTDKYYYFLVTGILTCVLEEVVLLDCSHYITYFNGEEREIPSLIDFGTRAKFIFFNALFQVVASLQDVL